LNKIYGNVAFIQPMIQSTRYYPFKNILVNRTTGCFIEIILFKIIAIFFNLAKINLVKITYKGNFLFQIKKMLDKIVSGAKKFDSYFSKIKVLHNGV